MLKKSVFALLSILAVLLMIGCGGGGDSAIHNDAALMGGPPTGFVQNLDATEWLNTQIRVDWDFSPDGVKIYRADNEYGPYVEIFDAGYGGATSFYDTNVETQTVYWYRARLYNPDGVGPHSQAIHGQIDMAELDAPANVTATQGDFLDKVQVSWELVTGADQYAVTYSSNTSEVLAYVDGNTWYDTDVMPGTYYYYTVYAVMGTNFGDPGMSGYGFANPGWVTSVAASDGDYTEKVNITWSYDYEGMDFEVYRADSYRAGWADLEYLGSSTLTAFNDYDAAPGETWWYFVRPVGYNEPGSIVFWPENLGNLGPDDGFVGTTNLAPAAPEWIEATQGVWPYDIFITWVPVLEADYYKLWVQDVDTEQNPLTTWSILAETEQPMFQWTMTTPDFTVQHAFRVQACIWTEGGFDYLCSGFSGDTAIGWTAPGPPELDNLTATQGDTTLTQGILVTWDDIGSESDYFVMERRDGEAGSWYSHEYGLTSASFMDMYVTPGQMYGYRVAGVNEYGQGEWVEFFAGWYPLAAPLNVTATDETVPGMIQVSWSPVTGADAYEVWRYNEELGETPVLIATVPNPVYNNSIPIYRGIPFGYFVRAIAYNGVSPTYDVLGPYSFTAFGTAGFDGCASPDFPTDVDASQGFGGYVEVTWTPVMGVNYYNIYRAVSENGKYVLVGREFGSGASYFEDYDVMDATEYWYMVRAVDNCGFSAHSDSVMGYAYAN